MSDLEAVVRWVAVLAALFVAFAPLASWLFLALPSRGAGVVLPLAMLGVVWPAWFASAGLGAPYATWMLWATAALTGSAGWTLLVRRRAIDQRWVTALLVVGAGWLGLLLVAVWVRGFTPDLTGTEKPMDAAFLSASTIAAAMPPRDPWFAGEPINYYYLGYAMFGSVARMSGIPSTTAFNLAVPTLFATTFVVASAFAWDALRPWTSRRLSTVGAVAAGVGVALAGNLYAPLAMLRNGSATLDAWWWASDIGIGWRSSRIVCDGPRIDGDCAYPSVETINEFPFFSFLLGDLHPHVMALPLNLVVLTLALARLMRGAAPSRRSGWVWVVAAGTIAGALYATNSWDFPTTVVALVGATWLAERSRPRRAAVESATIVGVAVAAWAPFWIGFDAPTGGDAAVPSWLAGVPALPRLATTLGAHAGERTSLGEFAVVFGVPLLLACWLLASSVVLARAESGAAAAHPTPWLLGALGGLAVLSVLLRAPVLLLSGAMALMAVWLLRSGALRGPRVAAVGLVGLGALLCAGVELFYIRDVFDNRMNTLFKFYYQVWLVFGLAAAIGLALLWEETRQTSGRVVLAGATAVGAVAVLAYPVVATRQWTNGYADRIGLDGMAYAAAQYPDERDAIDWLRERANPGDVVLEAAGCSYEPNGDLPFNRISAYTGIPTVIGWGGHERQWRGGQPDLLDEIAPRQADVARMYAEPDGSLVDDYGIDWLIIGRYEDGDWRSTCDVAGPYNGIDDPAFPGNGWSIAFERPTVSIWRRVPVSAARP